MDNLASDVIGPGREGRGRATGAVVRVNGVGRGAECHELVAACLQQCGVESHGAVVRDAHGRRPPRHLVVPTPRLGRVDRPAVVVDDGDVVEACRLVCVPCLAQCRYGPVC